MAAHRRLARGNDLERVPAVFLTRSYPIFYFPKHQQAAAVPGLAPRGSTSAAAAATSCATSAATAAGTRSASTSARRQSRTRTRGARATSTHARRPAAVRRRLLRRRDVVALARAPLLAEGDDGRGVTRAAPRGLRHLRGAGGGEPRAADVQAVLGTAWNPARHLYHFTHETMRRLVEGAGLESRASTMTSRSTGCSSRRRSSTAASRARGQARQGAVAAAAAPFKLLNAGGFTLERRDAAASRAEPAARPTLARLEHDRALPQAGVTRRTSARTAAADRGTTATAGGS